MDAGRHKPDRRRRLVRAELELWAQVTRHVTPMPGKERQQLPSAPDKPLPRLQEARPQSSDASAPARSIKPLAPLELSTLRKLSRGRSEPEAKLDLHGMRQAEAHHKLRGFLHNAHAGGLRLVIVVTGKGLTGATYDPEQRGVLRRIVPQWLASPDLRHIVLGFTEASRRHGGNGAVYVRLRAANSKRSHSVP
jgi:DNA-nicking Smr family endonuclease